MTESGENASWMEYHRGVMDLGPLSIFIRKLLNRSPLSSNDQLALSRLPHDIIHLAPETNLLCDGDKVTVCPILLDGFVCRYKVAADGGRQIVALKIPGEALDLQSAYVHTADHDMYPITPAVVARVPLMELEKLAAERPSIARALIVDVLVEGAISREWLLNIGRRNAEVRFAHLLCETFYRISEVAGLPVIDFDVPLTQQQLADVLGLTPVHVNRMVRRLTEKHAIRRVRRRLRVSNMTRLLEIAHFSDLYLHRADHEPSSMLDEQ